MHIREDHSAVVADPGSASASKSAVIDFPVKCNMASCASKQFASIKLLMTHFNSYHKKDARECVFYDCEHRFCQNSDSRKHFRSKHLNAGHTRVKNNPLLSVSVPFIQSVENQINMERIEEEPEQYDDDGDYNAFDIDEIETADPDVESEEYF